MTTSSNVPGVFDVAIDGNDYMIDTQYLESFRYETIDPIRRQADTSDSVGESSLNPEGYWRRSPNSWHHGAGQARYDVTIRTRNGSTRRRVSTSGPKDSCRCCRHRYR